MSGPSPEECHTTTGRIWDGSSCTGCWYTQTMPLSFGFKQEVFWTLHSRDYWQNCWTNHTHPSPPASERDKQLPFLFSKKKKKSTANPFCCYMFFFVCLFFLLGFFFFFGRLTKATVPHRAHALPVILITINVVSSCNSPSRLRRVRLSARSVSACS